MVPGGAMAEGSVRAARRRDRKATLAAGGSRRCGRSRDRVAEKSRIPMLNAEALDGGGMGALLQARSLRVLIANRIGAAALIGAMVSSLDTES